MGWFFSSFSTWLQPPSDSDSWSPYPKSRVAFDWREKSNPEMTLEQSGDFDTLQRYRYLIYSQHNRTPPAPVLELLSTEVDLRHHTQVESFWLEQDDKSEERKKDLDEIRKTIWRTTREWWSLRCEFGEGVISRAFDLWRSYPTWYMHEVLVEDCIRKQGCCSRGCGCCLNRQTHGIAAGHCALSCGCCRKAWGFTFAGKEVDEIYHKVDYQHDQKSFDQFQLASIWGLHLDSEQGLSDLIKSGCEQVGKSRVDDPENWDIDSSTTEETLLIKSSD